MTENPRLVPSDRIRTEITVVNSRFITTIVPVTSAEEARSQLHLIRDEMSDANHHVYAFRIGHDNSIIEGMSDDGEPSGTAGPPTLAVLRGSGLGDILLVVTRYFGGTKLGTGGLVRAYSEAARIGLDTVEVQPKIARTLLGIETPYPLYEQVKRLIESHRGEVKESEYEAEVTIIALFATVDVEDFTGAVRDLSAGRIVPVVLDTFV